MERRAASRFSLCAPAILQWTDPSGTQQIQMASTHDVSLRGAFLLCDTPLHIGWAVRIEVQLPALKRSESAHFTLKGSGKVIRSALYGPQQGIAVSSRFMFADEILPA